MSSSPAAGSRARSRRRCSAAPASARVVIDPHPVYPPDFRCEKLDGPQMRTLGLTGLADAVLRASTADRECWVARFGRVVEKRPGDQQGIMYDTLVNTLRAEVPASAEFIQSKVTDITAGPGAPDSSGLSSGAEISARLAVVRNRPQRRRPREARYRRARSSAPSHSISIGFDAVPGDARGFPFPALTYFAESPADRMAYITLFPIGTTMRANLFGYRDLHDPWLKQLRDAPRETLYAHVAGAASADGRLHGAGIREDPSGRSLCDRRLSPARRGAGRRRVRHVVPGGRHRRAQGAGRRRAALQRAHPALARNTGDGRGEDRGVLRRPGEAGVRCLFARRRPMGCARSRSTRRPPAWRGAGSSSGCIGARVSCGASWRRSRPSKCPTTTSMRRRSRAATQTEIGELSFRGAR